MLTKTCCVTGHKKIPADRLEYVKAELRREIRQAVEDGYTHFISGFEDGVDLIFASAVAELLPKNPSLVLEAAIPYRDRLNTSDELFRRLIEKCGVIGVHGEKRHPHCYLKRNRFMVSQSQRVIAVFDGREKGGTFYTVVCAFLYKRDVRIIKI